MGYLAYVKDLTNKEIYNSIFINKEISEIVYDTTTIDLDIIKDIFNHKGKSLNVITNTTYLSNFIDLISSNYKELNIAIVDDLNVSKTLVNKLLSKELTIDVNVNVYYNIKSIEDIELVSQYDGLVPVTVRCNKDNIRNTKEYKELINKLNKIDNYSETDREYLYMFNKNNLPIILISDNPASYEHNL